MIELRTTDNRILLPVKARAKGKRNAVTGIHDGRLKVSVTQAPENGKANVAIEKVIAKSLGLRRSQISLHAGDTNPVKEFLIAGLSIDELREKINQIVDVLDA